MESISGREKRYWISFSDKQLIFYLVFGIKKTKTIQMGNSLITMLDQPQNLK